MPSEKYTAGGQEQGANLASPRQKIFFGATAVTALAPIIGELSAYFFTGVTHGSLPASLAMVGCSILNLFFWAKNRKLDLALKIASAILLVGFSWGILFSGGLQAEQLIYLPLIPVINGFIFGRAGAILSGIYSILLCLLLGALSHFGLLPAPAGPGSEGLIAFQAIESVAVAAFIVYLFDLTRRQVEEALVSAQKVLEEAQSVAKISSWAFDPKTKKFSWSKEFYKLHPLLPGSEPPNFEMVQNLVHPEDREKILASFEICVREGTPFHTIQRIMLPNRILWIEARGRALRNSNGEIVEIHGTAQDITESMERENLVRFVLDSLKIGVWKFNPITQELEWDNSMYNLFGVTKERFSGHYQAWESTLTPAAKSQAVADLEMALRGEKEFNTLFEIQTEEGEKKQIRGRGTVLRNEKGEAVMMYGINWDKTKEALAERELGAQKNLLDVVLENLPTMVFVKDYSEELRFKLFNKAGQELLGLKEREIIGKNDYDLLPKEQADFFTKKDKEVFLSHRTLRIDQEPIATPRGQRWLRTYKVPTYKLDGSPDLLIGISTDITEELEMQKAIELERAKAMQNAKLASLGEMSAGIAHEINNPLAIIAGNIHLIKELGGDLPGPDSKIEAIAKAVERIQKIVKGLRKFARSTDGQPHKLEVLSELVAESLVLTEAKAKRHGVEITTDIAKDIALLCDGVEIEQVLVNLVNNGIDAVKLSKERWVKINAYAKESEVVLQVLDSGNGIPREIEQKLFQPFFTTKEVGEGTGLGLSIAKGILDQHNARLSLNPAQANTCFEIHFPQA